MVDFNIILGIVEPYRQYLLSLFGYDALVLLVYTFGIAFYAIFIWIFYRSLARKEMFKFEPKEYEPTFLSKLRFFVDYLFFALKYILLFPVYSFMWFAVIAALLFVLSTQPTQSVIFSSIALVAAVRITAYYNEDLSRDLAKLLPLTLLAIFVLNQITLSLDDLVQRVNEVQAFLPQTIGFLAFLMLLELLLKVISFFLGIIFPKEEDREKEEGKEGKEGKEEEKD